MKPRKSSAANAGLWFATFVLSALLAGCVTVKLVGDYDEQIDKGTTALQKDFETFLQKLDASASGPDGKVEEYAKNKQFYADARVAISGLRLRADATERNSLTVRMFDGLARNLDRMERMHSAPEGLTKSEIDKSLRGGFTTQFTAILTFELAKKRGDKPDENKAAAASTPKGDGK